MRKIDYTHCAGDKTKEDRNKQGILFSELDNRAEMMPKVNS